METEYVVIWSDNFPSTFYDSWQKALAAVKYIEADQPGVKGKIVTKEEYINHSY